MKEQKNTVFRRRSRLQRVIGTVAVCCFVLFLTGCKSGKNGAEKTVTPEETGKKTVYGPAGFDLTTPAPVKPERDYGSAEAIQRNRELHEIVFPKTEVAPLGTGIINSARQEEDSRYGICHTCPIETESVPIAARDADASGEVDVIHSEHISGLKDKTVEDKINRKIDEVVTAFADPGYIPNVSGIMQIINEFGDPKRIVTCLAFGSLGYVSVQITGISEWRETRHFTSFEEKEAYEELRWPKEDYWHFRVDETICGDPEGDGFTAEIGYQCIECRVLNLSLLTGEEVRLSDLFPEGTDYLKELNEAVSERLRANEWIDSWYYDETHEYDGGRAFAGLTGTEQFSLDSAEYGQLCIYLDEYYDYVMYVPLCTRIIETAGSEIYESACKPLFQPLTTLTVKTLYSPEEYAVFTADVNGTELSVRFLCDAEGLFPAGGGNGNPDMPGAGGISRDALYDAVCIWAEKHWPKDYWYTDDSYVIAPVYGYVYPNGYVHVDLFFKAQEWYDKSIRQSFLEHSFWMKDGLYIEEADLLDVSYEELLAELFSRGSAMNAEEAVYAASVLAPYISEVRLPINEECLLLYSGIRFSYQDNFGNPNPGEELIQKLTDRIPKKELEEILGQRYFGASSRFKPLDISTHLKFYEGYSFE